MRAAGVGDGLRRKNEVLVPDRMVPLPTPSPTGLRRFPLASIGMAVVRFKRRLCDSDMDSFMGCAVMGMSLELGAFKSTAPTTVPRFGPPSGPGGLETAKYRYATCLLPAAQIIMVASGLSWWASQ
ncbi:unnamed protein product [Calypogeia fissa]